MLRRTMATFAGAALALSLAACGGGDDDTAEPPVEKNAEFDAGTTMAKIADSGKVTIGTKFDQPGFGLLGSS